jgi:hypothetical protein
MDTSRKIGRIVRVRRHEHNFTIIDNTPLHDPRLSFAATGLLAYLLSKPDGWCIRIGQLTTAKTNGRRAITTALNELLATGYARRRRIRSFNGRFAYVETQVFETPQLLKEIEQAELFAEPAAEAAPDPAPLFEPETPRARFVRAEDVRAQNVRAQNAPLAKTEAARTDSQRTDPATTGPPESRNGIVADAAVAAKMEELKQAGVASPKRENLARIPDLSPEHIRQLRKSRGYRTANNPPGWLIKVIEARGFKQPKGHQSAEAFAEAIANCSSRAGADR